MTAPVGPQALTKEERRRVTHDSEVAIQFQGERAWAHHSILLRYEATVEALEAELAETKQTLDVIQPHYDLLFAERDRLLDARSSSLKDSERLDWLESRALYVQLDNRDKLHGTVMFDVPRGQRLREAITAASSQETITNG